MKFSKLPSVHRHSLALLANAGVQTTATLAKHCSLTPQQAAHELCRMRKAGLCFSHQKLPNEQYAKWEVTSLGQALFDGRPDAELVVKEPGTTTPKGHGITKFAVVLNFKHGETGTREQALLAAQHLASEGQACTVIGLVADVTPPEQPLPVVTLL